MKNFKKLLILSSVFLVCLVDFSESLSCVQCSGCSNPYSNVTNPSTACPLSTTDTCIKTSIVYPGGSMIQKGCVTASACSATSLNIAGYGFWISCCTTDGCNGAVHIKPTYLVVTGFSLLILFNKLFRN